MTDTIAVVGSGAMGSQIAMLCALARYRVAIQDIEAAPLRAAEEQLRERMTRWVTKGRVPAADVEAASTRMTFTTDLERAAGTADVVIEAAVEDFEIKRELFARLDALAPPHAVLATNSSTIVSSRLADRTHRPEKVCNLHFFNPPLVMECVEIVPNPLTSDATIETAVELTRTLGKTPVILHKEISGFLANRILRALREEAIDLYEAGIASFEDIDTACRTALGHPMGPFELMDLTGIDVSYHAQLIRFQETGAPVDRPRASVAERYERGELGRKTGKGWYTYDQASRSAGPR